MNHNRWKYPTKNTKNHRGCLSNLRLFDLGPTFSQLYVSVGFKSTESDEFNKLLVEAAIRRRVDSALLALCLASSCFECYPKMMQPTSQDMIDVRAI